MPIRPEMKARYPDDWKLRSRFVRFYRARNRCEWCGVPNGWMVVRLDSDRSLWWAYVEHSPGVRTWRTNTNEPIPAWNIVTTEPAKIVLTCAHIFDHRPEAASLLNLAALCQLCHNRHDAKMRREGIKARREENQMRLAL